MAAPAVGSDDDRCWSRIGVGGDRSCAQLAQHVHCRNCPVHARAAIDRLDALPPAGYLDEWARELAREHAPEEAGTRSVLLFRLAGDWLGLDARALEEVAALRPVHSLPHRRNAALRGLVNVRGRLLVCIALERILGLQSSTDDATERSPGFVRERLLVLSHEGQRAVVRADAVHGLHRFHPRDLLPLPATVAQRAAPYTEAVLPWEERRVAVLDTGLVFHTIERSLE